jgi:hypothetical protein
MSMETKLKELNLERVYLSGSCSFPLHVLQTFRPEEKTLLKLQEIDREQLPKRHPSSIHSIKDKVLMLC